MDALDDAVEQLAIEIRRAGRYTADLLQIVADEFKIPQPRLRGGFRQKFRCSPEEWSVPQDSAALARKRAITHAQELRGQHRWAWTEVDIEAGKLCSVGRPEEFAFVGADLENRVTVIEVKTGNQMSTKQLSPEKMADLLAKIRTGSLD